MPSNEDLIKGYLEELRGYEANGDEEGAKAVKAELRKLGHDAKKPADRAEERTPSAREVYPELKDKEWVRGEKDTAAELREAVTPAEDTSKAAKAK